MADQTTERFVFLGTIGTVTFAFLSQALKLQRIENDRRLNELNNEAGRLQSAVGQNVSADTWKGFHDSYEITQERYSTRFAAIERFQNKILGAVAIVAFVIPALTIVIAKLV